MRVSSLRARGSRRYQWKLQHPELLSDQKAVLGFIFAHGQRFNEPGWMRYPVLSVLP